LVTWRPRACGGGRATRPQGKSRRTGTAKCKRPRQNIVFIAGLPLGGRDEGRALRRGYDMLCGHVVVVSHDIIELRPRLPSGAAGCSCSTHATTARLTCKARHAGLARASRVVRHAVEPRVSYDARHAPHFGSLHIGGTLGHHGSLWSRGTASHPRVSSCHRQRLPSSDPYSTAARFACPGL